MLQSHRSSGQDQRADAPLLRGSNIGVVFRDVDGKAIRVLRDINLTVGRAEVVAVLGPSGCGKTTLLRVLSGLIAPTTGALYADAALMSRRGLYMTMVPQRPTLVPWLSVEENVLLPYQLAATPADRSVLNRAEELFRLVRLHGFRMSLPHELSGGMQMRVALVRALLPKPRLILMDEPFSALDEATRVQLALEMLRLVEAAGSSVVFVTHSVQEAALIADRILQMSARPGRIVAEYAPNYGTPRDVALLDRSEFVEFCARLRAQLVHD